MYRLASATIKTYAVQYATPAGTGLIVSAHRISQPVFASREPE